MMGNRWMCMGASMCAPKYKDLDVDYVTSAGDAIALRKPHYYMLHESANLKRYVKLMQRYRSTDDDGGFRTTICITDGLLNQKGWWKEYDEVLPLCTHERVPSWLIWDAWEPGKYCPGMTGLLAVQYAVNHGAREVHLVGMEGYTGKDDYFMGWPTSMWCLKEFKGCHPYSHMMRRIVRLSPQCRFICYGQMTYNLPYANVEYHEDACCLVG